MSANDPFAIYRYSMCLINGLLSKNGQNKEDIEKGYNMLVKLAAGDSSAEALTEIG
jgi:hypothetical protein